MTPRSKLDRIQALLLDVVALADDVALSPGSSPGEREEARVARAAAQLHERLAAERSYQDHAAQQLPMEHA